MIRPESIALAEAIAVAHNSDTPLRAKNLVAGLNEQSFGSAMYTDGFRSEITQVTGMSTAHTQVLEATSEKLAAVIRGGFDMIKNYGVPFAKALAAEVGVLYTSDRLQQLAFSQLSYNYIDVDDPFFDSQVYPTEVKNTALDFTSVSLEALKRLEFNYASDEEISEYVKTAHPDVSGVLSNPNYALSNAGNGLFDHYTLTRLFVEKNGVFNFSVIKSLEISRLLKMYVILTKMVTDESPVSWLSKGTLSDYREFISLLWNGMTRYLISLKQVANAYRGRVVAIGEIQPVRMSPSPEKEYEGTKFLSGDVQIFYTNKALNALETHGISFNEWLVAIQYARFHQVQLDPVACLSTPDVVREWTDKYYKSIDTSLSVKAKALFVKAAREQALKYLVTTPLLVDRVKELCGPNQMTDNWFDSKIGLEYEKAYYAVSAALAAKRGESNELGGTPGCDSVVLEALMSGTLVPTFLRAINCNLAADIVEATYVSTEGTDTITDKRQRLNVSLIKLVVKHSIGEE